MLLPYLHKSLSILLASSGLPPEEVDVRFERPERRWVEALTMPTLALFLFDLAESAEFRNAGAQVTRGATSAATRLPPRRFDLRFLAAAFATSAADEQALLWHALAALLKHTTLPEHVWPTDTEHAFPDVSILLKVGAYQDAPRPLDLWGALDLPPRASLLYTVTAPLDLAQVTEAPLVFTRLIRTTRTTVEDEGGGRGITPPTASSRLPTAQLRAPGDNVVEADVRHDLGGVLMDARELLVSDASVRIERQMTIMPVNRPEERNPTTQHPQRLAEAATDREGRFVLRNLPAGVASLRIERDSKQGGRERFKPVALESVQRPALLSSSPTLSLRVRVAPEGDARAAIGLPIPSAPLEIVIEA